MGLWPFLGLRPIRCEKIHINIGNRPDAKDVVSRAKLRYFLLALCDGAHRSSAVAARIAGISRIPEGVNGWCGIGCRDGSWHQNHPVIPLVGVTKISSPSRILQVSLGW